MKIVHVLSRPYIGTNDNEAYDAQFDGASFDRITVKLSNDELDADLCTLANNAGIDCCGVQDVERAGNFARFTAVCI